MIRLLLIVAALLFAAHACKGVSDTLQFHYDESRYAKLGNDQFWNPDLGWENKYATTDEGELIRPLRPRFIGSTTWLAWTTDAWHLFQSIQYALIRLAVALLILVPVVISRGRSRTPAWLYGAGIYAALWIIQAAGFHLTYTLL